MVKHYFTGLNTITTLINKYNVFSKHIFDVETIEELIKIKEFLNSNQEFLIKDSTGNNMYSASFNHFYRFACEDAIKSKQDIEKLDIVIPVPQQILQGIKS